MVVLSFDGATIFLLIVQRKHIVQYRLCVTVTATKLSVINN